MKLAALVFYVRSFIYPPPPRPGLAPALGGPGSLPPQGSHRSGRARLAHPAPQTHGFATFGSRWSEWPELEAGDTARESGSTNSGS
ncbi:MAG: hypothetical protein ACI8X5_003954 [Planctomycetota bacterium]|jgi:hypothetical protein